LKPTWFSFGGTAAIVTSMGLIVGLHGSATKASLVGSLLIIAVADNLTDSLSVHTYQEAENLPARRALQATVANFVARLLIGCSFAVLVLVLPAAAALWVSLTWGLLLLSALTYRIARVRGADPRTEIAKHLAVCVLVLAISKALGYSIFGNVHL
jgi:VIT1/CCC1 family predicted Fe2+/Mn2+ transporter